MVTLKKENQHLKILTLQLANCILLGLVFLNVIHACRVTYRKITTFRLSDLGQNKKKKL